MPSSTCSCRDKLCPWKYDFNDRRKTMPGISLKWSRQPTPLSYSRHQSLKHGQWEQSSNSIGTQLLLRSTTLCPLACLPGESGFAFFDGTVSSPCTGDQRRRLDGAWPAIAVTCYWRFFTYLSCGSLETKTNHVDEGLKLNFAPIAYILWMFIETDPRVVQLPLLCYTGDRSANVKT